MKKSLSRYLNSIGISPTLSSDSLLSPLFIVLDNELSNKDPGPAAFLLDDVDNKDL